MTKKPPVPTFAYTLAQLETLIARMEDNNTPLEQSLKDFESGIQLIQQAQKALQEAEQKVQLLLESNGEPVATPLADEGDESGVDE